LISSRQFSRCCFAAIFVVCASAQSPSAHFSANPAWVLAGGPDFALNVSGSGIFQGLVVRWNGLDHALTGQGVFGFQTTIAAAEIAQPGLAEVSVYYPPTGVTIGPRQFAMVAMPLSVANVVWDPVRNLIYAALIGSTIEMPAQTGRLAGTQVAVIDPVALTVIDTITVGNAPNLMALSDDARYLYVALDGEAAIQRVDLSSNTPDLRISIGPVGTVVSALRVMPGSPETIAVVPVLRSGSTTAKAVIFDRDVKRPNGSTLDMSELAFGSSPAVLYGVGRGLVRMTIDAHGIASSVAEPYGNGNGIEFSGGLLYFSGGAIDPETGAVAGDFGVPGAYAIDPARNRYYTFTGAGISAFDLRQFTPFGTLQFGAPLYRGSIDPAYTGKVIHWGLDGLALFFRETDYPTGGTLSIIRTPLAGPAPVVTQIQGTVAAGQTLTVMGTALGPPGGRNTEYSELGKPSTSLAGMEVYFDSGSAQMLFASDTQIDLIVPPGTGKLAPVTTMQVLSSGIPSAQIVLPIGAVNPSVSP
jgi:DNA-binding beta-propeller fold protein YncE